MRLSILFITLAAVLGGVQGADKSVISLFGSSVADGAFCSGNCSGRAYSPKAEPGGCYQSRLKQHQAKYENRSVFNNCHGGDTTTKLLARFDQMVATNAGFVFIGLSLANEGLPYTTNYTKVFDHYAAGMRELVTKIRALGAEPIIGSNYPNSGYNAEQYDFIKRINLLTQTWDLQTPQTNFLGTIDDGHGRWVKGFYANGGHPNDLGSTEMYYAIVPSIFDAIQAGKPAVPERANGKQTLTLQRGSNKETVQFTPRPEDVMHSFTFSFRMRCDGCNGSLAWIDAEETAPAPAPASACPPNWCKNHGYAEDRCNCSVCGSFGGCTFSCDASKSSPLYPLHACDSSGLETYPSHPDVDYISPAPIVAAFAAKVASMTNRSLVIDAESGQLLYVKPSSILSKASGPVINDGSWHTVLLTHYWCNGTTDMVVDGKVVSQATERLGPTRFQLQPKSTAAVSYQDLLIYRSGMNTEEQQFLLNNTTHVLQASLEVYAPLDDKNPTESRAQSMSKIQVLPGVHDTDLVLL